MNKTRPLMAATALFLAAGCSDSTSTETRTDAELTFTRPAVDAPPLATDTVSMWAVVGTDREMHLYYAPKQGETQGELCLRFRVRANSLLRRPDGSGFAANDSIRITLQVIDLQKQIFDFQPAGLRFAANEPAELKLRYTERDHDFNDDGTIDDSDFTIEASRLGVWKREDASQPWVRQSTLHEVEIDEVETDIFGFTHYVIAF